MTRMFDLIFGGAVALAAVGLLQYEFGKKQTSHDGTITGVSPPPGPINPYAPGGGQGGLVSTPDVTVNRNPGGIVGSGSSTITGAIVSLGTGGTVVPSPVQPSPFQNPAGPTSTWQGYTPIQRPGL